MTHNYPSDEVLEQIKNLDCKDFHGFMDFIHDNWEFADWGWKRDGEIYFISTAGWSGNEDIIYAMKQNQIFWMTYWYQSRRGGHYIFAPQTLEVLEKLAKL